MPPGWLQQQTWLPRRTSGVIYTISGPATRPEEEAILLTNSQHRSTASCDHVRRTRRGKTPSRFAALLAVFIVGLSIATSPAGAAALSSGPQSAPAALTGAALYGSFAQFTASTDAAPTLDSAGYVDDGVSLSFTAPSVPTGATSPRMTTRSLPTVASPSPAARSTPSSTPGPTATPAPRQVRTPTRMAPTSVDRTPPAPTRSGPTSATARRRPGRTG